MFLFMAMYTILAKLYYLLKYLLQYSRLMINFSRTQLISSQIILILVILANMYWWKTPIVGLIFGFLYLWLNSKKISDMFAAHIHKDLRNIMGLITILAYLSIVYTLSYHLYEINSWVFIFALLSLPLMVEIISWRFNAIHYFFNDLNFDVLKLKNIRSSWLPLAVFFLDLLLFVASLGVILYPLGYGYDSFIHYATLKNIASTGTIEPRLFFYIGQYGLTFFSHELLQIDLAWANKVLLPVCFALLWPTTLFYGLRYGLAWSFSITYFASILILPALFAVYQKINNIAWLDIFNFKLWPLFEIPSLNWLTAYNFPLDILYNISLNKIWLYTLLILLGLYFIVREHKLIFFKRLFIFTTILLINYLLTTIFLSFNLQIDYQKNDYINRIASLLTLFFLPIFLSALYFLFNSRSQNSLAQKMFITIITILCIGVGTYFSYPVYDQHGN